MIRIPILLFLIVFSASAGFAQVDGRIIHFEPKGDPAEATIEITDLFVGSRRVYFNEVFAEDEDWIADFHVVAKPLTDIPYICIEIHVGLRIGLDNGQADGAWTSGRKITSGSCKANRDGYVSSLKRGRSISLEFDDADLFTESGRARLPETLRRKSPDDGKYNQIRLFGATGFDVKGQAFELTVTAPSLIRKKKPVDSKND